MTTTHKIIRIFSCIQLLIFFALISSCNNSKNVQAINTIEQKSEENPESELVYDESYAYRTREDSIATEIWGNEILDDKYYTYYTDSILKILKKNDPYSPEGVRFNVENDSIATKFHKEQDAKTFIEKIALREILYMPEEHKQMRIVPTIAPHFPNALLETVRDAYHEHRPLALSPDVIWLTICQGMSFHINLNFKLLENKIYKNGHPEKISIRIDTITSDYTQWNIAVDSLTQQMRKYVDSYFYEAFVPQFSTTSPIDHVAYQITLLDAQKNAFSYIIDSGCGIPWIVLKGTTEDWELIKDKLSILDTLEMTEWKTSLTPIIDEFIKASKGNANKKFWMNIYKDKTEYGTFAITGWIHKLFPYLVSGEKNPFLNKKVTVSDDLVSNKFPGSTVKVPFTWHNVFENRTDSLYFWSGIWGAKQYGDKTLEPFISWALTKQELIK